MNWKEERFSFKTLTDAKDIKPGMTAKLIIGNEKMWGPDSWIKDMKGEEFIIEEVSHNDIHIIFPYEKMLPSFIQVTLYEQEMTEEEYKKEPRTCRGDIDWFEYKM